MTRMQKLRAIDAVLSAQTELSVAERQSLAELLLEAIGQ